MQRPVPEELFYSQGVSDAAGLVMKLKAVVGWNALLNIVDGEQGLLPPAVVVGIKTLLSAREGSGDEGHFGTVFVGQAQANLPVDGGAGRQGRQYDVAIGQDLGLNTGVPKQVIFHLGPGGVLEAASDDFIAEGVGQVGESQAVCLLKLGQNIGEGAVFVVCGKA